MLDWFAEGGVMMWPILGSGLVALMADWLAQAGGASAELIWRGLGVALNTTKFGLVVLLVSLAAWFGLRTALRRRAAR